MSKLLVNPCENINISDNGKSQFVTIFKSDLTKKSDTGHCHVENMYGHLVRLWRWWCCHRWWWPFCASNPMHALPWIFRSTQLAKSATKMPILSFFFLPYTVRSTRLISIIGGWLISLRLTTPITVWLFTLARMLFFSVAICPTMLRYISIKAIHFYSSVCPILYCHRSVLFSLVLIPFISNETVPIKDHVYEHEQSNQICHVVFQESVLHWFVNEI